MTPVEPPPRQPSYHIQTGFVRVRGLRVQYASNTEISGVASTSLLPCIPNKVCDTPTFDALNSSSHYSIRILLRHSISDPVEI
jgi:hypothetical protein